MAIAYDTFTNGGFSSSTTHTYSHTCTGSDRILFVQAFIAENIDKITGVTYNGVAMDLVNKGTPLGARYNYLFVLAAPASGANNVVITCSSSSTPGGNSTSYTGANQTGQPDASQSQLVTGTTITNTVTTVADNCWAVLVAIGAPSAASTNTTFRGANGTFGDAKMFDNNADITPAGDYTMTTTSNNSGDTQYLQASFAPVPPPPQLKTIGGLAIASVKSYNGLT